MTDRPIMFSPVMTRALLDSRKTQTRRLATSPLARCVPGDRLWVREMWADMAALTDGDFQRQAIYRADPCECYGNEDEYVDVTASDMRWRPSIHMPRWASRLTLHVEAVRVERLQDITEVDAIAEGMDCSPARLLFQLVWESLHGANTWIANPHVVVLTFRVERANIDAVAPAGAA